MALMEICPKCGSRKIRYGATLPVRCLRWLARSGKRYCLFCAHRFLAHKAFLDARAMSLYVWQAVARRSEEARS